MSFSLPRIAARLLTCRSLAALFLSVLPLRANFEAYGVFKGELYLQPTASAPVPNEPAAFELIASAVTATDYLPFVIYAEPGGEFPIPVTLEGLANQTEWLGLLSYDSSVTRDAWFPDGTVRFVAIDSTSNLEASLTLATSALPPIPVIANFTESQSIDPTQPFTLRWNDFTGAVANDLVWVRLQSFGTTLFSTAIPGAAGALAGSATEIVIPAGLLTGQEDIQASVAFLKVGQQTGGSLPDSTAITGAYRRTEVTLKLEGTGGSGDAPELIGSLPASGSLNVSPDTEVRFDFSRPMAPIVDIIWTANIVPLADTAFSYSWINNGYTLVAVYSASFPPNAFISWELGTGFQDLDGNPLADTLTSGYFFTADNTNPGDCNEGDPLEHPGNFFLTRALRFQQNGPAALVPHAEGGAFLVAGFEPPTDLTATDVSFTPPGGESIPLRSFFGSPYFYFAQFPDAATLGEIFPTGVYTARLEIDGSPIQSTVNASGAFPPTPEILNYTEAQAINPGIAFTLNWNAFTGADANSAISLEIYDMVGDTIFSAPNECLNLELTPTTTSIVIPSGTLQSNQTYGLVLNFYRITDQSEHSPSQITFMTAHGASTEITLHTLGDATGGELRLTSMQINDTGRFHATVTGQPGAMVIVESSPDLLNWTPVTNLNLSAAGNADFEDHSALNLNGGLFYRVRL